MDHMGHGKSQGEAAVVPDFEDVDTDLHSVVGIARQAHPRLPLILVGHSMGGMIAARYAQKHPGDLTALVLSAPVLGSWTSITDLLELPEIPDTPLDVSTLSRDPEIGDLYDLDPLVYHGPFKRETVQSLVTALAIIDDGPKLGDLPTLWVQGGDDRLVPIDETRAGIETLELARLKRIIYPGAQHEVLNETNKREVMADVTDFIALNLG